MKNLFKLSALTLVTAIFAAGCANDPAAQPQNGDGTLRVVIKNPPSKTRALLDGAIDAGLAAFEGLIHNVDIYVFDQTSGYLEEAQTVSVTPGGQDEVEATFSNVSIDGLKRIVAIANIPAGTNLVGQTLSVPSLALGTGLSKYSDLAAAYVNIEDQLVTNSIITAATTGLLMTGVKSDVQNVDGVTTDVELEVERVVAKVSLGEITFGSDVTLRQLLTFSITDAAVQSVPSQTYIGLSPIKPYTTSAYYGGFNKTIENGNASYSTMAIDGLKVSGLNLLSSVIGVLDGVTDQLGIGGLASVLLNPILDAAFNSVEGLTALLGTVGITGLDKALGDIVLTGGKTLNTLLAEELATFGAFWYVLPNDNAAKSTKLTLKGTYNGSAGYYPIEINAPDETLSADDANLLEKYIERNTEYVVNLQFNKISVGVNDPDVVAKTSDVAITISAKDWEGPVTQNATW